MIEGARLLPLHHITIRVPWHDHGWIGTICNNPCANTSCSNLPRIAKDRDDLFETKHAGLSIKNLDQSELPPCVNEHGTIMAPFPQGMQKQHPYTNSMKETHGHFADTPYTIQPYSAATIPFRWMLKEQTEGNTKKGVSSLAEALQLDYNPDREPILAFPTGWVQEGSNQRIMLDTFFSAAKPDESLVFFYAKRTPLLEDPRRVIIGVGKVKSISSATEYRYVGGNKPASKISGFLWERNIEHSIRPDGVDGFLLPYQNLLELSDNDDSINLIECIAFAPNEFFENYSYGSELLPHDGAIASLLALEQAINNMRLHMEGPWDVYIQWIDNELNRLWKVRGAFPGLGSALNAFGMPHGNLLAWHLTTNLGDSEDPWVRLSESLDNPETLPEFLRKGIGNTIKQKWKSLPEERRALLKLLARFNLRDSQTLRWYQETDRIKSGINTSDAEIIANPFRIYEEDRLQVDSISFAVIDRGLFPPEKVRKEFPVPIPSKVYEAIDERRVRAVMIQTLEDAGSEGHTLLPSNWLIQRIRTLPMKPECPIDKDVMPIVESCLSPLIKKISSGDTGDSYQLSRYVETSALISEIIEKRKSAKLTEGNFNWLELVNKAININFNGILTEDDKKARKEKAAALEILFCSRVCVLMGAAGTGKSTLLKALCQIEVVKNGGILLLAPTGKARVRLEKASGMEGKGQTVAQFLNGLKRYDGAIGRYYVNKNAPRSSAHKTVVIDESSMLTEEQLAALLDAVKGVERLILVGDPKQLPPIGAGRPYVDIVNYLKPENYDSLFPIVAPCYTELTVTMRQMAVNGNDRVDILLANAFSGRMLDAGADEVWHKVSAGLTPYVKLLRWNQSEQLQQLLINELTNELKLKSDVDEVGFECSIGGVASEYNDKTYVFFNTKYNGRAGSSEKVENWQILSPTRLSMAGVDVLNRTIQTRFRKYAIDLANKGGFNRKIPAPAGPQGIVWGDKVINVINNGHRKVYPEKNDAYVANGDVGIVTGNYKKNGNKFFNQLEVELSSQPGFAYKYWPNEFDGQDSTPPLELAYALTIHKTQGSEFGTTFLIIPNPCRLLTREMLYTALTRHKNKVIIFHQGDFKELQRYAHEQASEISKRLTNLFRQSRPVEIVYKNKSMFLDSNLIYLTENGELVRSKSEWIIADKLHAAGIDYQYEQGLKLGEVERFPDFTIVDDDSGTTWYWEHNGMLSNDEYRKRWEKKLAAYIAQGITPFNGKEGNLLITEEREGAGLDLAQIKKNIDAILGK